MELPRMEDIDNYVGDDARVKNTLVAVDVDDDEKDVVDADIAAVGDVAVVAAAADVSPSAVAVAVVVDEDDAQHVAVAVDEDDAVVPTPHHPVVVNASE
mmetsp:Transcript_17085/g.28029  ORF Transcript_17085/g.28029 Transcript_17085/m.28029 type:complete len:99 (+) Transcript_17085:521-817(+)